MDRKARKARRRAARRVLRSPARTAVKVTATLVVVLAFLALGDRWAVLYAENMAAEKVQESLKLHAEPEVHINSFPFLGQVAMGNIDNVEVNVPHVPAGPVSVAQVKGSVDDIRIVGSLPSSVKGAVLSKVRGDVFLSFDDLNREVGASQVTLAPGKQPNTVQAKGDLPVAGKKAQIRGRAHLERTGDRGLALSVEDTKIVDDLRLIGHPGVRLNVSNFCCLTCVSLLHAGSATANLSDTRCKMTGQFHARRSRAGGGICFQRQSCCLTVGQRARTQGVTVFLTYTEREAARRG
ncbi:LmeA family phospholipid-binding protein [Streptomyces sp. NBC_00356]|uniref:LmeA family phospholipid-binding protein n=1 Tax=Streptomyces sp. NBC_00356 TaxID=2975724 RepID=UPI002E27054B